MVIRRPRTDTSLYRPPKPHRERLVVPRERLQQPEEDNDHLDNLVFMIKHPSRNLYLRRFTYLAMVEAEKWKPLDWADHFLSSEGAERFAKRMLGHDDFIIIAKPKG